MAEVLAGRKTPREAVGDLMLRPQRGELDERVRWRRSFRPHQAPDSRRPRNRFASAWASADRRADAAAPRAPRGRRPSDVDTLEAVEDALIAADVGLPATERILDAGARRSAGLDRASASRA